MAATGYPIWLMVAIFLGMGVLMIGFQWLVGANEAIEMDKKTGATQAKENVRIFNYCMVWEDSDWTRKPSNEKEIIDEAAKINLLNEYEYEAGDALDICDCAVYLFEMGKYPESEARPIYLRNEVTTCFGHEWTLERVLYYGWVD